LNLKGLRLYYLAAAEAGGADPHALVALGGFGVHRAQIDVPTPLGDIVGVTNIVSRTRPFAANFTNLCHDLLQKIPEVRGRNPNYTGITAFRARLSLFQYEMSLKASLRVDAVAIT
jgi:hypothetical protein